MLFIHNIINLIVKGSIYYTLTAAPIARLYIWTKLLAKCELLNLKCLLS